MVRQYRFFNCRIERYSGGNRAPIYVAGKSLVTPRRNSEKNSSVVYSFAAVFISGPRH